MTSFSAEWSYDNKTIRIILGSWIDICVTTTIEFRNCHTSFVFKMVGLNQQMIVARVCAIFVLKVWHIYSRCCKCNFVHVDRGWHVIIDMSIIICQPKTVYSTTTYFLALNYCYHKLSSFCLWSCMHRCTQRSKTHTLFSKQVHTST